MADYPWYGVVDGGAELEQGDILLRCPVIVVPDDLPYPLPAALDVQAETYDLIVVTQSCDLANDKIPGVVLCPHWDLKDAARMDPALAKKNAAEEIAKGRRPRYCLLAGSGSAAGVAMGNRLVDFGRILRLPKQYVRRRAVDAGPRLRLLPPYKEHVAQAFAHYYMRVALPQEVKL
jgi:hypothetical protein